MPAFVNAAWFSVGTFANLPMFANLNLVELLRKQNCMIRTKIAGEGAVAVNRDVAESAYQAWLKTLNLECLDANGKRDKIAEALRDAGLDLAQVARICRKAETVRESALRAFANLVGVDYDLLHRDPNSLKSKPKKQPSPRAAGSDVKSNPSGEQATTVLKPGKMRQLQDDFVSLHIMEQYLNADRSFLLEIMLNLPRIHRPRPEDDAEPDELRFTATVTALQIVPYFRAGGVQPIKGTILGQSAEADGVKYDGIWSLDHPKGRNDNPLAEAVLCEMRATGQGPYRVELVVRCLDTDIDIELRDPPKGVNSKQKAVVRRVLQQLGAKANGMVELVRADIASKDEP